MSKDNLYEVFSAEVSQKEQDGKVVYLSLGLHLVQGVFSWWAESTSRNYLDKKSKYVLPH